MNTKKEITEIIHYDFGELERISFYIDGFLSKQKDHNYKFTVKRENPDFLKQSNLIGEWHKFALRLGLFEFKDENNNFFFCIDRGDHSSNYMNEGYIIPILKKVKYYFKTNYNSIAIDKDPQLDKFRDKIIPIGPSFPLHITNMLKYLPKIISFNNGWTFQESKERLNLMFRNPKLSYLINLRNIEPKHNLFFVVPYYSNQKAVNEFRYEVMKEIEQKIKTNLVIGFASRNKLPDKYQYFKQPRYEMRDYFRHLARSKVSIYVRGPHDGISSKLGQLLALGKPIIGQTIYNNKELYYQNKFFNEQFAYDDPREIAKHAHELLQHPEKAELYANSNAHAFDTRFAPEIAISNIIERISN